MSIPSILHRMIGLFDSGIGGVTVLQEVRRLLPAEDMLYLADQAHCPYGPRPVEELQALSLACAQHLIEAGARLVVVACNTASAAALQTLRSTFPQTPFVGMVPAVKPAVQQTRSGVVGVLATPATLAGRLLSDVVARWAGPVRVLTQPCPGLVELIEAGAIAAPETRTLLETCLTPLLKAGVDTLVLGCTHYPFVRPLIEEIGGPGLRVLDAAPAVARRVAAILEEAGSPHPAQAGTLRYRTTGDPGLLHTLLARLGMPDGSVTQCHLKDYTHAAQSVTPM